MAPRVRIGTAIRRARERRRLSQADLAYALGVSRSAVNAWENDRAYPQSSIGAIEEVLGIRLDGEPEPDVMPEGLRDAIRGAIPDAERAALVEQVVEAALKGEELPVGLRRRRAASLAPPPSPRPSRPART